MITEILEKTKKNGGVTYNLVTDSYKTKGFAVSIYKSREVLIYNKLTEKNLVRFIAKNGELLYNDRFNCLGTWVNKGITYLDITRVVKTKQLAISIAKRNKQIAIYDLEKECEILV